MHKKKNRVNEVRKRENSFWVYFRGVVKSYWSQLSKRSIGIRERYDNNLGVLRENGRFDIDTLLWERV